MVGMKVASLTQRPSIVQVIAQFRMVGKGLEVMRVHYATTLAALLAGVVVAGKNCIAPFAVAIGLSGKKIGRRNPALPLTICWADIGRLSNLGQAKALLRTELAIVNGWFHKEFFAALWADLADFVDTQFGIGPTGLRNIKARFGAIDRVVMTWLEHLVAGGASFGEALEGLEKADPRAVRLFYILRHEGLSALQARMFMHVPMIPQT